MPTHLPHRSASPGRPSAGAILAGGWLAGLVLLTAVAGAMDGHASCGRPAAAPAYEAGASRNGDAVEAALRDMLDHD